MAREYWINLFSDRTWTEFLAAGGRFTGARENRWAQAQKIKPGDYLLGYMTGISRWIGILEATGPAFKSDEPIWKDADFPVRVPVRLVARLDPETGVPFQEIAGKLSFFPTLKSSHAWTGWVRGSPSRWRSTDGEVVAAAILDAVKTPVVRVVDARKLRRMPPVLSPRGPAAATASAADPAPVVSLGSPDPASSVNAGDLPSKREETAHTEVQWQLAKLGSDMGLGVWVARNDVARTFKGQSFRDLPGFKDALPVKFDDATTRAVELIDLMWLSRNSILSAFEIESTTQVYSGLLRLADLIALHPNLQMRLYIVAPDSRREKVRAEINRPVFARLEPPMSERCKLITFEALKDLLVRTAGMAGHFKDDVTERIAERCSLGNA